MRLLDLPVELRLRIYSIAVSSLPNVIHVDEGATSRDPPRSSLARALADVDTRLSKDMIALYWSTNVFQSYLLSGMGHYIATDSTFHRWLKEIVKDAAIWVRYLKFKGMAQVSLEHAPDCFAIVDVDLKRQVVLARKQNGQRCSCEHAEELAKRLRSRLRQVTVVDGQICHTRQTIWDIFDCWFTYHPTRSRPQRSWEEFERQYGHYGR